MCHSRSLSSSINWLFPFHISSLLLSVSCNIVTSTLFGFRDVVGKTFVSRRVTPTAGIHFPGHFYVSSYCQIKLRF